IPAAIASAFVVTVPLPDAAESTESPRLVVPDVRDVTIKTRRSFDAPGSTVVTDILYLKGPWQRREEILEFPKTPGWGPFDATSPSCDVMSAGLSSSTTRL